MNNKTWMDTPTRKQTIIFGLLGIFATVGLILSMTNFLKESLFQGRNFVFFFLLITSVLTTIRIIRNYLKSPAK